MMFLGNSSIAMTAICMKTNMQGIFHTAKSHKKWIPLFFRRNNGVFLLNTNAVMDHAYLLCTCLMESVIALMMNLILFAMHLGHWKMGIAEQIASFQIATALTTTFNAKVVGAFNMLTSAMEMWTAVTALMNFVRRCKQFGQFWVNRELTNLLEFVLMGGQFQHSIRMTWHQIVWVVKMNLCFCHYWNKKRLGMTNVNLRDFCPVLLAIQNVFHSINSVSTKLTTEGIC